MKKILTALAVVAMLASGGAFASGKGGDCNGLGNCNDDKRHHNDYSTGDTYNGRVGDTNNTRNIDRSVTNIDKSRDNYARGGRGGDGGTGVGVGIGKGGDSSSRSGVRDSGNSRNRNTNTARQGQGQGQQQGQVGINKSHNDNTNVGIQGQVGINRNGSVRGTQHSSIDGNNSAARNDGNNTAVDASDNSTNSVYYEGDEAQKRNPVSTAYAAPLVASDDTCMGSTSAGGQGITLGFSFASTWRDKDCVIRKDARFLHNSQHQTVALGLMCDKDRVRKAVAIAGSPAERLACGLNEDGSEPSGKAAAAPVTTTGSATVVPASTFDWGDED